MPQKRGPNKGITLFDEWLNNPIKATFSAIASIFAFIAIGISIGVAKTESDCNLEKLKLKLDYDSQVQKIKDDFRDQKLKQYENTITNLTEFVKEQQIKNKNEK